MVCTIFSYTCIIFLQNKRFKNYPTIFINLCRSYLQRFLTQVLALNFDREVACREETRRWLRGTRPTGGISCRDNREKKLKTSSVKILAGLATWLLQALATFVGRWDIAAQWMLSLALSSPPRFVSMHQPKGLWPRLTVQLYSTGTEVSIEAWVLPQVRLLCRTVGLLAKKLACLVLNLEKCQTFKWDWQNVALTGLKPLYNNLNPFFYPIVWIDNSVT